MISLIYTGIFHKSFSIKGNDEQKQKEKHIARVTMVVKEQIRNTFKDVFVTNKLRQSQQNEAEKEREL
jgi:hypothetical protein